MSTMVLSSPQRQTNWEALDHSQKATRYNQEDVSAMGFMSFPFLSTKESPERWTAYENLLYSCLRTGDDKAAHFLLERLAARFGEKDERVMGLRGLFQEAMAEDHSALLKLLPEYDRILAENPTNTPIRKRRIALLCSLSRKVDAINALAELLAASPTDIEAWAELADLYVSQGLYQQAEFCLEEILLSTPNAWNIHARLGEVLYVSAATSPDPITVLAESVRRFCRSIELCDRYIRGCYGLKLASEKLTAVIESGAQPTGKASSGDGNDELPIPSISVLQKMSEKAISVLAEAARDPSLGDNSRPSDSTFVADMLKSSTTFQER